MGPGRLQSTGNSQSAVEWAVLRSFTGNMHLGILFVSVKKFPNYKHGNDNSDVIFSLLNTLSQLTTRVFSFNRM